MFLDHGTPATRSMITSNKNLCLALCLQSPAKSPDFFLFYFYLEEGNNKDPLRERSQHLFSIKLMMVIKYCWQSDFFPKCWLVFRYSFAVISKLLPAILHINIRSQYLGILNTTIPLLSGMVLSVSVLELKIEARPLKLVFAIHFLWLFCKIFKHVNCPWKDV